MSDILARIDELKKKAPPPSAKRAAPGRWVAPAWVVRGLVEDGYGVMEAVRIVVNGEGHEPVEAAETGIRQAYYKIKGRPWSEKPETA